MKNGQANTVVFSITNPLKEDRLLTLQSVTGAFLNPKKTDGQRGRVLRNMTTSAFKSRPLRSVGGRPVQIPYNFVPEFKPQELSVEFSLLINDEQTGKKHRIHAYRGQVQVIEPPKNWFDLQLISVYLISLATIAGLGYIGYSVYLKPEVKDVSGAKKKFDKPAAPVVQQTGVQDEWIVSASLACLVSVSIADTFPCFLQPEHHLRSRQSKPKSAGALSSGDDEPSTPKRRGKGRK